jgi:hypothetical protein
MKQASVRVEMTYRTATGWSLRVIGIDNQASTNAVAIRSDLGHSINRQLIAKVALHEE